MWPVMRALATRELSAFFVSPAGWVVTALFAFGSNLVFLLGVLQSGRPASLRFVLEFDALFLMLAAPAVTMAAIGEERRQGVWALLRSAPVPTWALVGGKFIGAAAIGMILLVVPSVMQILLLEGFGRPDLGEVYCGLAGVYLLMLAVMASGLLASAMTGGATTAFLITALSWVLAVVVLEMALPSVISPDWASTLAAVDPLQRLQAFTLGLFDAANVAYFVGLIIFFLTAATVMARPGSRRLDATALGGLVVAVAAVVVIAGALQWRVDATKSRRYSLSPRTATLLEDLQGKWTLAVLLVESRADPAVLQQVDEVLDRYQAATDAINVQRIDPTDPASVLAFESLLQDLRSSLAEDTAAWDAALDQGDSAMHQLVLFAQTQAGPLRAVAQEIEDEQLREALQVRAGAMALLAAEGMRLLDAVAQARAASPANPLADRGAALAIQLDVLSRWAEELDAIGRLLAVVRPQASEEAALWRAQGAEMASVADVLRRLPPSELASMGALLAQGEAAVVIGPDGAAVVPAAQLLPSSLGGAGAAVAVDQRFRGDQVLAAAIGSLQDGITPRVVFVHVEDTDPLGGRSSQTDLSGPAAMLSASRIKVEAWHAASGTPVEDWSHGPTAWIIVPPLTGGGLKPSDDEQALLTAAEMLLARGQNVMVNLHPSLLPRYGQRDPWAALLSDHGIAADTGRVLLQAVPTADGGTSLTTAAQLADFPVEHPIAQALHGQDLVLPMPVTVAATDDRDGAVELGLHRAGEGVWMEDDWRALTMGRGVPTHRMPRFDATQQPEGAVPLIAATEWAGPDGPQRLLVVGSGGWLRSGVADQAVSAGGGRIALAHPGNHELLLAGASWLSHLDDRIAAGPLSQDVARLGAVSATTHTLWSWMLLGVMPVSLLITGITITIRRRDA